MKNFISRYPFSHCIEYISWKTQLTQLKLKSMIYRIKIDLHFKLHGVQSLQSRWMLRYMQSKWLFSQRAWLSCVLCFPMARASPYTNGANAFFKVPMYLNSKKSCNFTRNCFYSKLNIVELIIRIQNIPHEIIGYKNWNTNYLI